MSDTYALPTWEERLAEPSARRAYWAYILDAHARQFQGVAFEDRTWHVIAPCVCCSANTGSWCDTCETDGRHFFTAWGQMMVGKPLCSRCEAADEVTCAVCGA